MRHLVTFKGKFIYEYKDVVERKEEMRMEP